LKTLDLHDTAVTDRSIATLAAMTQLSQLRIEGTKISEAGRNALRRKLRRTHITQ